MGKKSLQSKASRRHSPEEESWVVAGDVALEIVQGVQALSTTLLWAVGLERVTASLQNLAV